VTIPRPTSFRLQRPALRTLALALAFLGLCVFAWGLKYKLSLYDPPHSISHHMPAAKLLSGKERRALPLVDSPAVASSGMMVFFTSLLFAAFFLKGRTIPGQSCWFLLSSPRTAMPVCVRSAPAFSRPPPRTR
jgi:hypothetical protein